MTIEQDRKKYAMESLKIKYAFWCKKKNDNPLLLLPTWLSIIDQDLNLTQTQGKPNNYQYLNI